MHGSLYWQAIDVRDRLARLLADHGQPRHLRARARVFHASCHDATRRLQSLEDDSAAAEISRFLATAEAFLQEHGQRPFP